MSRLLVFYLRNFFTQKSTYIITIVSILTLSLIAYTYKSTNTYGFVFTTRAIWYTVMFFSSITFVVVQVIAIFKKTEDDGTSLFLVSKPISRLQQVLSQLIMLFITILFFSLSVFVVGMIVGLLDFKIDRIGLAKIGFSVLVANIIIMSIFGSFVLLTSLWVSSRGMISIWSIIIFFLPTFSMALAIFIQQNPFSKGNAYSYMPITTHVETSTRGMKPKINVNNIIKFDYSNSSNDNTQKSAWKDYMKNKNWTRWIDPYGQLSNLYRGFYDFGDSPINSKWIRESAVATKGSNDLILKNNNKEYLLLWESSNKNISEITSPKFSNKFNDLMDSQILLDKLKTKSKEINLFDFGKQIFFAQLIFMSSTKEQIDNPDFVNTLVDNTIPWVTGSDENNYFVDSTWYALAALYYWNSKSVITLNFKTDMDYMSKFIYNPNNAISEGQQLTFLEVGQTYNVFIEKELIPKIDLIAIWLSIFIVATIVPSYIYVKWKKL